MTNEVVSKLLMDAEKIVRSLFIGHFCAFLDPG
eukprot:CAMPEP_0197192026 /NCGR_PEP_ID=MMETSP1423-20130617/24428_1 /TAXON_ID=476441 /ORGANISM="Pseudo-nitzschia heimii, Strain UNC1101" /LENGTH=32 /DNA_ID= /DNA_START= /DNA_END= /DNA_ORIENTATION=